MSFFTIDEIKGQDKALDYLKYYIKKPELIPPLLIFHGPASTGKWFAAERFTRHIMCETGDSCGFCNSCRLFMKNMHPDYIQFPVGKNIAIGDEKDPEEYTIRWLQNKRVPYKPHMAKKRLVMIPDASLINNEAETALLKSLEESPEHTRFIFLVDDLKKLKDTIISRGVKIPFQFLSQQKLNEINSESGVETRSFFGGSINPFNAPDAVIEKIALEVEGRINSTVNLLVIENWVSEYKNNHPEWDENFSYHEFLELLSLYLVYEYTKNDYENNIQKIEEIFKFKYFMQKQIANIDNFLVGQLFHNLMQYTN